MSEYILKVPERESPYDPAMQAASLGEKIVRCRDCMHMEPRTFNDPIVTDLTVGWFLCSYFERPTRRDGFCAWGDRK